MKEQRHRWAALAAAAALAVAGVTGCSTDEESGGDRQALRDDLPQQIRDSGKLSVGTNAPFAPMEFRDQSDHLVGFDIDVVNAIGEALGVTPDYLQSPFPALLPGVAGGEYDVAARGLFDTKHRQEQVDMVTYYSAGTQWAGRSADRVDPNNACGLKVGAEIDTVQFTTELPAKSVACTDAGQEAITVVPYDNVDLAMEALVDSDVDAVSADSPVILYAIKNSDGRLAAAGDPFDTQPYALAVARGSSLGPVLQKAIQQMIDDGDMQSIAQKWGLEPGLIETSTINGATS